MTIVHAERGAYTLSFARGEEVMAGLIAFAREQGIRAAHFAGLGAASRAAIAYYNLQTRAYEKQEITEDVEILSLVGNIGVKEGGETVVHAHGVFGRRDLSTFGGHVLELTISGAGEMHLQAFPGEIRRAYDEETGLALMRPLE